MNIGVSEDDFNVLEARLFKNPKFTRWCSRFANANPVMLGPLSSTVNRSS